MSKNNKGVVVITGCNGFIGRNLTQALSGQIDVLGLDVAPTKNGSSANCKILQGNMLNRRWLGNVKRHLKRAHPIYFVHLVGLADVGLCQKNEKMAYELNVKSLINVCDLAKSCGAMKVVLSSTALVYAPDSVGLVSEKVLPKAENTYAKTKLKAEKYLIDFASKNGIEAIVLRLSNIYGEGMNSTTLIPKIVEQTRNGILRLRSYDGVRDYLYIKDAVSAFSLSVFSGQKAGIYNVCSSKTHSVRDVVKTVGRLLGTKSSCPDTKSRSKSGRMVLSNRKIKRELLWNPECTLNQGLKEMISN